MKTNLVVMGAIVAGCAGTQTGVDAPAAEAENVEPAANPAEVAELPAEPSASGPAPAAGASADADGTITVVKCVGIAMKGHNDCGSLDGRHDCSGKATKDLDPTEWVYVPDGPLCEKWGGTKLVKDGNVVKKQKPAKDFIGG